MLLKKLNEINYVRIHSVEEKKFSTYGRIVDNYDFKELIDFLNNKTEIPENGNVYYPSILEIEKMNIKNELEIYFYGEMPIQIGYCNGKNSTYNGFEYHKCSEINIAATDLMLVLGHVWDLKENKYNSNHAEVFFVPKGTAVELFQTTLHLSPCRVRDEGFSCGVVLLKGTNTPLSAKKKNEEGENKLLLHKNKWILSHPDRKPLINQGVYPGLLGKNKQLFYK